MAIKADIDKAKKKAAEEAARAAAFGNFGPMKFWKPAKPGKYNLRFMPPWTDEGVNAYQWWREIWMHWGIGPDDDSKKNVVCPKKTPPGEGECPICDEVERLKATGDPADLELSKEMRARVRIQANIIDLKDPKWTQDDIDELIGGGTEEDNLPEVDSPKIQVYGFGSTIFKELLDYFNDEIDFTDLEEGYDVILVREGTTKNNTKYRVRLVKAASQAPVPDDDPSLHNLDAIHKVLSTPEIVAIMEGVDPEEARKLAAKQKSSQKKLASKSKKDEDEEPEADEPEEEPEAEEPEEEAPEAEEPEEEASSGNGASDFPPLDADGAIDFDALTDEQIENEEFAEVQDQYETSPHIACFGGARQRDENDPDCQGCPLFNRCGERIAFLDKPKKKGPGKKAAPGKKSPGKKAAGKKGGGSAADDLEAQMRKAVGK